MPQIWKDYWLPFNVLCLVVALIFLWRLYILGSTRRKQVRLFQVPAGTKENSPGRKSWVVAASTVWQVPLGTKERVWYAGSFVPDGDLEDNSPELVLCASAFQNFETRDAKIGKVPTKRATVACGPQNSGPELPAPLQRFQELDQGRPIIGRHGPERFLPPHGPRRRARGWLRSGCGPGHRANRLRRPGLPGTRPRPHSDGGPPFGAPWRCPSPMLSARPGPMSCSSRSV